MSSTNTFVPSGLTALIASAILVLSVSLSAPSKSAGFADTLSAGLLTLFPAFAPSAWSCVFTNSEAGITLVFPSGVVTVAFPWSSTTTVVGFAGSLGFTFSTAALIASFSVWVNLSGCLTIVLSTGFLTSSCLSAFSRSAASFAKSNAGIVATAPSFVVTVAFPAVSNTTVAPGFTFKISALIFSSSAALLSGLVTTTLVAGVFTLFPALALSLAAGSFSKSSTGIVAVFPSGVDTVAFPFSSTTTFVPSGFTLRIAALIFPTTSSFLAGSAKSSFTAATLSAGLLTLFPALAVPLSASVFTNSVTGIVAVCPSGVVTVAFPFASTTTVASGLTASTLALIAAIFSGVKASLLAISLSTGLLMLFPALAVSLSASVFTKSAFGITTVLPSFVVTVAFPLSSTTTVAPGLTASTAALIASLDAPKSAFGSATTTLSAGLFTASCLVGSAKSVLAFTKSATGIVAVFPSGVVTVAFPFSSITTVVALPSLSGLTALTFAVISSFNLVSSSDVKSAIAFSKTTLSAGVFTWFPPLTASLSPSSFTNSLTGIVAVFASTPGATGVVTVAFPFSSTTTVAPGFTASTAALILAISSGCNDSLFPTRTLSAGLLM